MTPEEAELELAEAEAAAELEQAEAEAARAKQPAIPEPPTAPEPAMLSPESPSGTALRSFGQGASYGFSDELAGVSGALQELGSRGPIGRAAAIAAPAALGPLGAPMALAQAASAPQLVSGSSEELGDYRSLPVVEAMIQRFRAERERARRETAMGARANPRTSTGATLLGGFMTPGPKVTRIGAAPLTRLGSAVASGATGGALYGAGASNETTPASVAKDAAGSAIAAAALAPVAVGAGDLVTRGLNKLATSSTLKALGVRAGISDSLARHGYESKAEGEALAKQAQDLGLIRPFRTAEDVARRAADRQQNVSAPVIDDVMTRADKSGTPFDFNEAAWTSAEKLMSRGRPAPAPLNPQEQAVGHGAMNMVRRISETTPEGLGSFSEANRLKRGLQNSVNYGANATKESTQMQRAAASGMRQSIEEQVGRALSPEDAESLAAANRNWGTLEDVRAIATEEARRQAQRKFPLWQTMTAGVLGTGAAGPQAGVAAAGLGALTSYLGPRAPSTVAAGARALAPLGAKIPAAATTSIADPMGPLRQYLGLSPEERRRESANAFSN